ncbi:hypothetical protein DOT37_07360 [Pantoea agglomerans]|nr:hypothetical protein DOT37_07360 [Pantoea agglomerans]
MEVRALVAIAGTKQTYPITLESEPKIGDPITLHVDKSDRDFVVVEVNSTGFSNAAPYLYGVYVKPKT